MKLNLGMLIAIALWTLLVAPVTCGGGLLAHACEDDEQELCHHENDCPSDPCNVAQDVTAAAKTIVKMDLQVGLPVSLPDFMTTTDSPVPAKTALALTGISIPDSALPLIC